MLPRPPTKGSIEHGKWEKSLYINMTVTLLVILLGVAGLSTAFVYGMCKITGEPFSAPWVSTDHRDSNDDR